MRSETSAEQQKPEHKINCLQKREGKRSENNEVMLREAIRFLPALLLQLNQSLKVKALS